MEMTSTCTGSFVWTEEKWGNRHRKVDTRDFEGIVEARHFVVKNFNLNGQLDLIGKGTIGR